MVYGSLLYCTAGAQTIARIGENDSLIIHRKLNEVIINGDHIDQKEITGNCIYSENVEELLERNSSISLIRRGNYASEISVRGMATERIGLTIDGMKIFSACTDKMDPASSYVSSNNLEEAHIEKDGLSKSYGSNIGGQVNFRLKEPRLNDSKKIKGNISTGGQSNSPGIQGLFNTNYSEKNWGIRLNGLALKNGNYYAGGGEEMQNSHYEKKNIGLGFKGKLSDQDFILLDFIVDDARDIGYPALPMDVAYANGRIYSLSYSRFLQGKISGKLKTKIYGNNIKHLMDDSQRNVAMRMDMPGESDTYGTYIQYNSHDIGRHKLFANLDAYVNRSFAEMTMYPENEIEMYMLTWPDVHRQIFGLFLSDKYTFKNKHYLLWASRLDVGQSQVRNEMGVRQFEIFGYDVSHPYDHKIFSTSFNYGFVLDKHREIGVEMAYAERLPSVSEQFGYYIFNSQDAYNYIGDPSIKKEQSFKGELTFKKQSKQFYSSAAIFGMHLPNYILGIVDEEIDAITLGANGVKVYQNLPYAQMTGFEFDFSWITTNWLKINTAFSFTYGIDNEQNALPLIPPLKNTTAIQIDHRKSHFNLEMRAAAEQRNFNEMAGESKTPGYAILNLAYNRKFNMGKQHLLASGGLANIFDTYYYDHLDWNNIARPGRNFFLKLQYQIN